MLSSAGLGWAGLGWGVSRDDRGWGVTGTSHDDAGCAPVGEEFLCNNVQQQRALSLSISVIMHRLGIGQHRQLAASLLQRLVWTRPHPDTWPRGRVGSHHSHQIICFPVFISKYLSSQRASSSSITKCKFSLHFRWRGCVIHGRGRNHDSCYIFSEQEMLKQKSQNISSLFTASQNSYN